MAKSNVYYGDIDPYLCQWLRNLVRAGILPQGEIDERPIRDVAWEDLREFDQAHFFAGIGGWPLALQIAGVPNLPCWTGSCPCQPFSVAGKHAGSQDERHLWPIWFRLISQCRPSIVFGEQVAEAIAHGWLDATACDLEAENYTIGAAVLPACSVGAPHKRDRLFFVAHSICADSTGRNEDRWRLAEPQPMGKEWAFSEWNRGQDTSGVLDDGIFSGMAKKLAHGFGNALVPQVAAEFIQAALGVRP